MEWREVDESVKANWDKLRGSDCALLIDGGEIGMGEYSRGYWYSDYGVEMVNEPTHYAIIKPPVTSND